MVSWKNENRVKKIHQHILKFCLKSTMFFTIFFYFLFFIFLMFFTILLVTVSQKVTPWANLVKCLQHIVSGPKTKVIKFFYNLCDFLSSKIHAFISIIYPWHSKYNTAKKNKSLEKPSFSKNWAKNKDLGRIKKLTSLAVLFIPARWLTVFVVLWI